MNNQEIRRRILKMLYESFKDHPYGRITPKEFQKSLNISLKELRFNAIYLEEKGLIELQKPLEGSLFVGARATPKGIDIVEDEYQLDIFFPAPDKNQVIPASVFENIIKLVSEVGASDEIATEQKEVIINGFCLFRHLAAGPFFRPDCPSGPLVFMDRIFTESVD